MFHLESVGDPVTLLSQVGPLVDVLPSVTLHPFMLLLFHASASWDLSRQCLSSASAASASGRSASRCLGGSLSPLLFSTLPVVGSSGI